MYLIISTPCERAKELYNELNEEYKRCIDANKVSNKAKIITHEILELYRHALDHSIRVYWNKKYYQLYGNKNVYFPIGKDINSFQNILKKAKMGKLKSEDPEFINSC